MNLLNKVVVITGASQGLGRELAEVFSAEKSQVVISSHNLKDLNVLGKKTGAFVCVADVTRESDLEKLAAKVLKQYGRIDIWINNAGITIPHSEIWEINSGQAHHVMEVNFFGTFYGSRVAAKIMRQQKQGLIINIVSTSSLGGRPRSAIYSASKWAARGFTEALSLALEQSKIAVLAVHPGAMKTNLFGKHKPANYQDFMEARFVANKIIKTLKKPILKKVLVIRKPIKSGLKK